MYNMKLALVVCLSLISVSCKETFLIKASTKHNSVDLTFYSDGIFKDTREKPCIKQLSVYRSDNRRNRIWEIRPARGECVPLEGARIGVPPPGFVQEGGFSKLSPGVEYVSTAEDNQLRLGFSKPFRSP